MLKFLPIIKNFPLFSDIEDEILSMLLKESSILELKTKNTIFLEGSTDNSFFLLIKGVAKGYFSKGKSQVVDIFYTEGNFLLNSDFLIERHPCKNTVECISTCLFIKFNRQNLSEAFTKYNVLQFKLLEILFHYSNKHKFHSTLLTKYKTTTDSFLEFQDVYHEYLNSISDKDIASYLGISPEAFNRLKKSIKSNQNIYS